MTYIEGFIVPVPTANRETYRKHANDAWSMFEDFGANRLVEAWGDDVPDGQVTDLKRAVQLKPEETVVFSWFEYPDKAARDAANTKMREDPRMKEMGANMPFDAQRMIFGGFKVIDEQGEQGRMGYTEGMLAPIAADRIGELNSFAAKSSALFIEYGAERVVEGIEDDVPEGKVTDFHRAVQKKEGEKVVFSWIEWPSKAVRDEAWTKIMADERMRASPMPWDTQRMTTGGFEPIVDTEVEALAPAE